MGGLCTLHLSQACPVLVDVCNFFLTEFEKSSGPWVSSFGALLLDGVPEAGDPESRRLGGIFEMELPEEVAVQGRKEFTALPDREERVEFSRYSCIVSVGYAVTL